MSFEEEHLNKPGHEDIQRFAAAMLRVVDDNIEEMGLCPFCTLQTLIFMSHHNLLTRMLKEFPSLASTNPLMLVENEKKLDEFAEKLKETLQANFDRNVEHVKELINEERKKKGMVN